MGYPTQLRAATYDDLPLIRDSWKKSFRQSYHVRGVPNEVFYRNHDLLMDMLLRRCSVLVICDREHPRHVFAWTCVEIINNDLVVHFLYVKGPYQDFGMGTEMLKSILDEEPTVRRIVYTMETKAGAKWAKKMAQRTDREVEYNPYLLYKTAGAAWQ